MDWKLGPDEGNSGALVRWGRCLDNGVWLCAPRWRRLRRRAGYLALPFATVRWGN